MVNEISRQVRNHYERLSSTKRSSPGRANPELELIATSLSSEGSSVIADVGCGWGRNTIPLARSFRFVVGVDFARNQLSLGRRFVSESKLANRVEFVQASCLEMPFNEYCFDGVVCTSVLFHLPQQNEREMALREISRVLRPGGILLLDSQNLWNPANLFKAVRMLVWAKRRNVYWSSLGDSYIMRLDPVTGESTRTYARFQSHREVANELEATGFRVLKRTAWTKTQKLSRTRFTAARISYLCRRL